MGTIVLPISAELSRDSNLVGGKAAGLGDLCRAGALVPPGVVLVLPRGACKVPGELRSTVDRLAASAGQSALFAVRSSTCEEDGAEASYAGMFKTRLNVAPSDVGAAVLDCAASIESARVTAYRQFRNLGSPWAENTPIIVQQMVSATSSGVAFSVDPVSQDRGRFMVEAVRGLGEALMSGEVTPELHLVDASSGRVIRFEPGDWPDADRQPALGDKQVNKVVQLLRLLRARSPCEIDVEFAFAREVLFALQMRPVTALVP